MRIGYGTYGMPSVPIEEALKRLASMGYEGIELAVASKFPTAPEKLDEGKRREIRSLFNGLGLELPAFLLTMNVIDVDLEGHRGNLEDFKKVADLANDLALDKPPAIVTTVGGRTDEWESVQDLLVERLVELVGVAAEKGCVFAIELHVHGAVDRPDRGLWVLERVNSSALKFNFDISHFDLIGLTLEETVPALVPHSVHTHVKDGHMVDGKSQFLLPGEGDFDYVAYLKAMSDAGYEGFITVEISGQIWSKPDYDPFAAAEFSYKTLESAFEKAGIKR